jgi:predicted nuclease of predicted toxin-antitoxin system
VSLLLDQNLSRRLVSRLAGRFPGISHVALAGLEQASDAAVWSYARTHGFTLVTKDSDFSEVALLEGSPPKVVWLRLGNCTTAEVERVLRAAFDAIQDFERDAAVHVLELF